MAPWFAFDPDWIDDWCAAELGSQPAREVFETGHLSYVKGVELTDGRRVVVKVRPWADRLLACEQVHAEAYRAGYPCPAPLVRVQNVAGWAVSAEALIESYQQLPLGPDSARLFAEALFRLVRAAPTPESLPPLSPTPPWADWQDTERRELWPPPDDRDADLNALPHSWVDGGASVAREYLLGYAAPPVVAHLDWYSPNLGWADRQLVAVFDWDSVGVQPEPAVAGLAAAVWPASGGPREEATVEQTEDFLLHYPAVRNWRTADWRAAWAAGVWTRCFDAKKAEAVGTDPDSVITESEAIERLRRADLRGAL